MPIQNLIILSSSTRMPFKPKELLGNHPECDHFYNDVAGFKHGGRMGCPVCSKRAKKAMERKKKHKKDHRPAFKAYDAITHTSRLVGSPGIFANPPSYQRPSYFAIPNGVSQSFYNEHPQGYSIPLSRVAHSQEVAVQTNPQGLEPVDAHHKRAIPTSTDRIAGNMANNPLVQHVERAAEAAYEESALRKSAEHAHMAEHSNNSDGIQKHASVSYFAPAGAPGNHPGPKMSQRSAPLPVQYLPLHARAPQTREQDMMREMEPDLMVQPLDARTFNKRELLRKKQEREMEENDLMGQPNFPPLEQQSYANRKSRRNAEKKADEREMNRNPILREMAHPVTSPERIEELSAMLRRGGRVHHSVF